MLQELQEMEERLRSFEIDDLDLGDVRTAVGRSRALVSTLEILRIRLGRRANELLAAGPGSNEVMPTVGEVADNAVPGLSGLGPDAGAKLVLGSPEVPARDSERDLHRLQMARQFPSLDVALHAGHLTPEHLDVLYRLFVGLDSLTQRALMTEDERLARLAARWSPARFGRSVRQLIDRIGVEASRDAARRQRLASNLRAWVGADGMGHVHLELDPEWFDSVMNAVEAEARTIVHQSGRDDVGSGPVESLRMGDHLRARALVERLQGRPVRLGHPTIGVVVDARTLLGGPHEHTVCETVRGFGLAPETLRRLTCDAQIRRIVLDDDGVPIAVGRLHRTATEAQWAALNAVYATCAWAGCGRPISWCQAHHVERWEDGGRTDLDNLVPLCSAHHHDVHEGGWSVTLRPDRSLHIHEPDGTHRATGRPDRLALAG